MAIIAYRFPKAGCLTPLNLSVDKLLRKAGTREERNAGFWVVDLNGILPMDEVKSAWTMRQARAAARSSLQSAVNTDRHSQE